MAEIVLLVGVLGIFASLTLALSVVGVITTEKRQVSRSLDAIAAMSSAPVEMTREVQKPFTERVIDPMAARFTGLGRRLTPDDQAKRLQHKLDVAGNPEGWNLDRILGMKVLGFTIMLALSVVITMLIGLSLFWTLVVCVGLGMAGFFAPNMWISQKGHDRSDQMRKDLPDALDLLTISVEAGLAFDAALSRVAKSTEGPLAAEFARVLQEMNIGTGRTAALRALGDRTHIAELRAFVTAMVQADAFGIPMSQVLRVQSVEMRVKRRQRAEEKAQKVPVKILFPLIFCILPTLFIAVLGPGVITMMTAFSGTGVA
jgi:tight adherence protein C